MVIVKRRRLEKSRGVKILWISFLMLDIDFYKTSRLEIMQALARRGHTADIIAIRSKNVLRIKNSGVNIISIPLRYVPIVSPIIFAVFILFFLPVYIIVSKPNYIITEPGISIFGFALALPFCRLLRIKLILDVRSMPVEIIGFRGFLQRFFFAIAVLIARKFFDGITIISSLMRQEICEIFKINSRIVGVWSSGVSTSHFNPEKHLLEGLTLRKKLGLTGKFVIFYHGAFSAHRGLIETVKAISIVKRTYPNVVLFLLGAGPIVCTLKDLIQKENLQDTVIIHDPVEYAEVPKYIAVCDVGIVPLPDHPYWRYQCPLKLLEYLAMNKTVIVTDIPAHRTVIGNEKCGIYIASINPNEIAKAIIYAYQNKEKLGDWGAIGRIIINRKYAWKKVASDLEKYLLST